VLYNIHKRVQQIPAKDRMVVMASIVDMHFTVSLEDFMVCRDREPIKWRQNAHLVAFADYFEMQWLQGHYWR
jgi:hypothetical protein